MSRFVLPYADIGSGIKPSSGAKLFFFDTNTSTPKNTYSDEALTVANTNPVISDSNGLFGDIWLEGGQYKVRLKDKNDVQQWEADPVDSFITSSDSFVIFDTVALAVASKLVGIGDSVTTLGYTSVNDGGGADYIIVGPATGTDNKGSFHDMDNGDQLKLIAKYPLDSRVFGIILDDSTDNATQLERLTVFSNDFVIDGGVCRSSTVNLGSGSIKFRNGGMIAPINDSNVFTFTGVFAPDGKEQFYKGYTVTQAQANFNSGYSSAPTVVLTSGSATTNINTSLEECFLVSGGTGGTDGFYQNLAVTGGGGTGGTCNVWVDDGAITAAGVSAGGSGYTSAPTIDTSSITGLTGEDVQVLFGQLSDTGVTISGAGIVDDPSTFVTSIGVPNQSNGTQSTLWIQMATVLTGAYTYSDVIYPENFGAKGDGTSNDLTVLNVFYVECAKARKGVHTSSSGYACEGQLVMASDTTLEWDENVFVKMTSPSITGHLLGTYIPNSGGTPASNITLYNPQADANNIEAENAIGFGLGTDGVDIFGGTAKNALIGPSRNGGKAWQCDANAKNVRVVNPRALNSTHGFSSQGKAGNESRNNIYTSCIAIDCDTAVLGNSIIVPVTNDLNEMSTMINGIFAKNCGKSTTSWTMGGADGGSGAFVLSRGCGITITGAVLYNEVAFGEINSVVRGVPPKSKMDIQAFCVATHAVNSNKTALYFDNTTNQDMNAVDISINIKGDITGSFLTSQTGFSSTELESGTVDIKYDTTTTPTAFIENIWAGGLSNFYVKIQNIAGSFKLEGPSFEIGSTRNTESTLNAQTVYAGTLSADAILIGTGTAVELTGTGVPQAVVIADIGSTYRDLAGGAGTTFWVKESQSGTSNGWVAK